MPSQPDWDALKRPLRSCAIGAICLFAFLAAWQLLIPGGEDASSGELWIAWGLMLMTSVCLPSGIGLPVSAARRLWRAGQRSRAALPVAFLIAVVVVLPAAVSAAGAGFSITFSCVLLALLASATVSAYLIVSAKAAPGATPPTDFNTDEPHAYASDIPRKRKEAE